MKNKISLIVFLLVFSAAALFTAQVRATSMDELYGWVLEKDQKEFGFSYGLDLYQQEYSYDRKIPPAGAHTAHDIDFEYPKSTFGVDLTYGLTSNMQLSITGRYSLDQRYDFSYVETDSSTTPANYNWRADSVDTLYPFSLCASLDIRPIPPIDIKVTYDGDYYKTRTHTRYGQSIDTTANDLRKYSLSYSNVLAAEVTYLSDPKPKRDYIKSDIDGILHTLVEKNQLKILSRYELEYIEAGYRSYGYTSGEFFFEKWHRNSFYNELGFGISDSIEADIGVNYYIPYTKLGREDFFRTDHVEYYRDLVSKYIDTYDLKGVVRKRIDNNAEFYLSGSFSTTTMHITTNSYYASDHKPINTTYPYTGRVRMDIYSVRAGQTYISDAKKKRSIDTVDFDMTEMPLLEKGQFMVAGFFDYSIRSRSNRGNVVNTPRHNSYHQNTYVVSGDFSYGLLDTLQFTAGVSYEFPYKSKVNYFDNFTGALEYTYTHIYLEQLSMKFQALFRPYPDAEISIDCGYRPFGKIYYPYETVTFNDISKNFSYIADSKEPGSPSIMTRDFGFDDYYMNVRIRKLF